MYTHIHMCMFVYIVIYILHCYFFMFYLGFFSSFLTMLAKLDF